MHPYPLHFLRVLGISVFFVFGAMLRLGGGPEALVLSLWWVIKTVPVLMLLMIFNRYGGVHGLGRVMMLVAAALGFAFGWAVRDLGDVAVWSVAPAACVVVVVLDLIIGRRYRLWGAPAAGSQGSAGAQASP
jgi:hypothetical protein